MPRCCYHVGEFAPLEEGAQFCVVRIEEGDSLTVFDGSWSNFDDAKADAATRNTKLGLTSSDIKQIAATYVQEMQTRGRVVRSGESFILDRPQYEVMSGAVQHTCWNSPGWDGELSDDCPGCLQARQYPCRYCGYGHVFTTHSEAHAERGDYLPSELTEAWHNSPHIYP